MNADKPSFRTLCKIVEGCLDVPAATRARALIERCAGDEALLEEALDLLLATVEAGAVKTPPVGASARSPDPTVGGDSRPNLGDLRDPAAPPGSGVIQRIGDFDILEELGRGGMGVVYLAKQRRPVERDVAIKIALEPLGEGAQLRLAAERQALARMSHPHVARILEAGATDDGRPYFAMEYVEGEPILEFCDRNRLSVDRRLRLFLQICSGVEHAHRNGILHRDLKPSNILVDSASDAPSVKIIDFGIAKAVGKPLADLTMTGQRIVGTPGYLSPESISSAGSAENGSQENAPDTRSDVYSLGVLLQELLIGRRLLVAEQDESAISLLSRVLEEDPPSASARWRGLGEDTRKSLAEGRSTSPAQLLKRVRGDLEWILRRATTRDREQRYGSVSELAAEVRRHLVHEPVLAGPPTATYRLLKLVRRHRAAVAVVALLTTALAGGFVARSVEANRANREAARATRQAAEALAARDETAEIVRYLTDVFTASDPTVAAGQEVTVREVLERGVERLEGDAFADRPRLRASLLVVTGRVFWRLGELQRGLGLVEGGRELLRGELDADDPKIIEAIRLSGAITSELEDFEQSERLLLEALERAKVAYGEDSLEVASIAFNLGATYEETGRFDEALEVNRQALAIYEVQHGDVSTEVGATLVNLALVTWRAGHVEQAEAYFRRAIGIFEDTLPPNHPSMAVAQLNLGNLLFVHERSQEAAVAFRKAVDIGAIALGPDHPDFATMLNSLGAVVMRLGDWEEAERLILQAKGVLERSLGPRHSAVAFPLYNLGRLYEATGELAKAEASQRAAVAIRRPGKKTRPIATSLCHLATVLRLRNRPDEALAVLDEAASLITGEASLEPLETLLDLIAAERGLLALGRGDLEAAEAYFGDPPDDLDSGSELSAEALGTARLGRAEIALARGDRGRAAELAKLGLAQLEQYFPPSHARLAAATRRAQQIAAKPLR